MKDAPWSGSDVTRMKPPACAGRDVDDRGEDLQAVGRLDRGQADVNGKLAPILSSAHEVVIETHFPGNGLIEKGPTMLDVARSRGSDNEAVDRLPDEGPDLVTEHSLEMRVRVDDQAADIRRDDPVRAGIEDGPEPARRLAFVGRIRSFELVRGALVRRRLSRVARRAVGTFVRRTEMAPGIVLAVGDRLVAIRRALIAIGGELVRRRRRLVGVGEDLIRAGPQGIRSGQ